MTLKPVSRLAMPVFFILLLSALRSSAQDKQDKHVRELLPVSAADFAPAASPVNDSSGAVILADIGEIHYVGNEHNWFDYVFQRHTRIKIVNKKAFDLATVNLSTYRPNEDPEKLEKLTAVTYNFENGQVTEAKLEKKDIFEEKQHDYVQTRFTLPAVKEGSIIDYSYTKISKYNDYLPTWQFQSESYPCLWSELMIEIPQAMFYTLVKQGIHPYFLDKGSESAGTYRMADKNGSWMIVNATITKHHWIMKDIPAFHVESYLYCPENYVDKVDFQLSKLYNGEQFTDYRNNWGQVTEDLIGRSDFGAALDEDDAAVTDCLKAALAGGGDFAAQARQIYYYVARNFTCNNHNDMYIQNNLRDVVRQHSGTVGDINLLLTAMLRKIGLKADPVVMTTRDQGVNLATYPIWRRLNYVIVRLDLQGTIVYLDAAQPKLGFGQLDGNCYNGPARIISKTDSGSVDLEADSLLEKKATVVFITTTDKGAEGTWESTLGPQESYELRRQVSDLGEKTFFKNIQTQFGEDIAISNGGIDSLDKPEDHVKVHYSFTLHPGDDPSKIYLNPFIGVGIRKNPFMAAERKYPVEMPYISDEVYVFSIQIPDGYSVEELPKSAKAALNGKDGTFDYLIGAQAGMIQLRCRLKLNRATFGPEDYSNLRDFYALVVQKEAESIVLKKN